MGIARKFHLFTFSKGETILVDDYSFTNNLRLLGNKYSKENSLDRITINSKVCHGKPTIRNMRYPVENLLEPMASGMTIENLLAHYPDLEKEDFLACLQNAARLTRVKSIYRLA